MPTTENDLNRQAARLRAILKETIAQCLTEGAESADIIRWTLCELKILRFDWESPALVQAAGAGERLPYGDE